MRSQFALNADLQGVARGGGSLSQGLLLKWRDHVHVQSSRSTTAPGGQEDVSWSGEGVGDQVRHLPRRGQGSRLGSTKEYISNGIVSCNPVCIAPAPDLVVPKGVCCAAAFWTGWHARLARRSIEQAHVYYHAPFYTCAHALDGSMSGFCAPA